MNYRHRPLDLDDHQLVRIQTRLKTLVLAIGIVACLPPLLAHPSVGIVMDSRGNIYYSDLKHVWKISPGGRESIAVRNVHTHELYIDSLDNLYGEHLWYEGEAADRWGDRVWRLGSDGTLVDVIPARVGFRDDYDDFHFVRDRDGNMYWADRGEPAYIRKRSRDGSVTSLAHSNFRDIRWMTVTPDGTVYLVDHHDLVRVTSDGAVRTVAKNLADRRRSFLFFDNRHAVMGLWTDPQGNVYAAVHSDGVVRKFSPDGGVSVVARSPLGWSPTGGLAAPNGDLWLLEWGGTFVVHARRIAADGKNTVFD